MVIHLQKTKQSLVVTIKQHQFAENKRKHWKQTASFDESIQMFDKHVGTCLPSKTQRLTYEQQI